jgi:hypothetical protein
VRNIPSYQERMENIIRKGHLIMEHKKQTMNRHELTDNRNMKFRWTLWFDGKRNHKILL